MSRFVLKRKSRPFQQGDSNSPKIRVKPDTYALLTVWAQETGLPITELARQAVNYAAEHLAWEGEEYPGGNRV